MRRLYIIILCLCCCLTSLQAQNNETLFRDIYDQEYWTAPMANSPLED